MRYKCPRNTLLELAQKGAGTTRTTALKLLELDVPDKWPKYARRSRENALKKLACKKSASAKSRIAALRAVLFGIDLTTAEELKEGK